MAFARTSIKPVAFVYDFAVNGGAVSSINMGAFIPGGSVVTSGFYKCLTTGVGGTYSVGFSGSVAALITAQAAATIVAGTVITTGLVPAFATPLLIATTVELQFTIAAAPMTAGKALFFFTYIEMPL